AGKSAFFLLMAYVMGSIPFGVLVSRLYRINIHQVGSKNPGATNVLRTVGKKAAILTLLGDLGKGAASVALGRLFLSSHALVATMGLLAIIGHDWSIFSKFQGGKGVATSLGVFLILAPYPVLLALLGWLIILGATRYVSLASIMAGILLPVLVWFFEGAGFLLFVSLIAGGLLILRHKQNIHRLMSGTENKLGKSETRGSQNR
ncbi:MAG: glycerol-3-phosphate 1-O-acyltransferase PlsY, partial [bacterium]